MKLPKWYCIATGQWAELKGFGTTAMKVSRRRSQNKSASSGLDTPTRPTLT